MLGMRRLTGVLAAAALLAAGCGGTTAQPGTGASSIVPASAPAFIAVDSNPDSSQWRTIDRLASKFPDKQKAVDSIKQEMSKEEVDWNKDVKPALGDELDFVWLDFENGGQNFVLLVQPHNAAKFKDFVDKANKAEDDPGNRAVYEKFRGWYVLAPAQTTIDRFERQSNAQGSLAEEHSFTESMDRLGNDAVVRSYINGKFLMNLAQKYGGTQAQKYLDKLGTLDWIAARLGATSEGVGFDAIVHGTPGSLFRGASKSPAYSPKLLDAVPADALLFLSFRGSKNMFGGLQKNAFFQNAPQFRQFVQPLQQIGRVLEGENAIYLRPGTARSPSVPFAIPEVTLVSTPKTAGTPIVDRMVKRLGGGSPRTQTVAGTRVHAMASAGVGLYYADVDGRFVVTDQPSGIRGLKGSGASLSDSKEFQQTKAAAGVPGKTWGMVYVNISASVPYGEKLAQRHIPAEIARNIKPLRSAVEYAASHTHEFQLTFFLRIK